ncbi:MAG: dTMP kinase [Cetobacterium sp.]|uniref:dTMP kinase n=1 Tax=Cetobacterium sp. TaxID=2071632 RepID=UPI003EE73372
MKKGFFIEMCGLDGSGKTTHANFLKNNLELLGYKVSIVHAFKPNRYSGEVKKFCKNKNLDFNNIFSKSLNSNLFLLDLIENLKNIELRLNNGEIVIAEKYITDSIIYIPILSGNNSLLNFLEKKILEPDIKVYLKATPEDTISRVINRSKVQNKEIAPKENIIFAKLAKEQFDKYFSKKNSLIIDTAFDEKKNSEVLFEAIVKKIQLTI